MDTQQFQPIFELLDGAYPSQQFNERNERAYFELLRDLPVDLVHMATKSLITDAGREFPPKPGEIRARCLELQGAAPPPFALAWTEVSNALQTEGRYGMPEWSHPVLRKMIPASVWLQMCDAENMQVAQGQFRMAYENTADQFNKEVLDPADVQEAKLYLQKPAGFIERNKPMRSLPDLAASIQADLARRDERLAAKLPAPRQNGIQWSEQPSEVRARHKQLREAEKPAR